MCLGKKTKWTSHVLEISATRDFCLAVFLVSLSSHLDFFFAVCVVLSVLLWPLVVYHELIQKMYTGLEPILMKLDYSMKGDTQHRKHDKRSERANFCTSSFLVYTRWQDGRLLHVLRKERKHAST